MCKKNPSLNDVAVGDIFVTEPVSSRLSLHSYISTVRNVGELTTRFGKPDRVLTVQVASTRGLVIDVSKQLWWSQLIAGLV